MPLADPYEKQVKAQALDTFYRGDERLFSTVVIPLGVTWAFWRWVDQTVLISWLMFALAVAAAMEILCWVYKKRMVTLEEYPRWGRYMSYLLLAQGLYTGAAFMLFFFVESVPLQVALLFWVAGYSVASINQLAYWLEGYYAFVIPAMTLTALRLLMEKDIEYQILAGLLLMAMLSVLRYCHYAQKSVFKSIRLRFENLDLVHKAETASRDKTRFLAAASHDLRQPVHALSLFADALHTELQRLSSAKAISLLHNMENSILALNQLLSSLLDISKLDANIVQPNLLHFDIAALSGSLRDEYTLQAQLKKLDFAIQIGNGLIVHSDPVLLDNILRNLISNALRYTQTGSVTVTAMRRDSMLHIEVRDTGIGIAKAQQKEIFREFYQLENPERDRSQGLGLGLAIVERLAVLLNARILLESEPGKGSCFTIVLPLSNIETGTDNPIKTPASELDKIAIGTANPSAIPGSTPTIKDSGLNGMRVLVIDDETAIRQGMAVVLASWNCVATQNMPRRRSDTGGRANSLASLRHP